MRSLVGVRSNGSTGTTPDSFTRARQYASAVGQAPGVATFSIVAAVRNIGEGLGTIPFFGNSTAPGTDGWYLAQTIDVAGPPTTRVFAFGAVDGAAAAQTAGYAFPSGRSFDTKTLVLVGVYVGGTSISLYANGILVGQDATVGASITAGTSSLQLGYLAGAGGDLAMNNDIIAAGYIPSVALTQADVDELTAAIIEEGTLESLNGTGNFTFTHLYEARDLVHDYLFASGATPNQLPDTWANQGSSGTAGDLTITATTYGSLETRAAVGF